VIEPRRFSATIRHDDDRRFRQTQQWDISAYVDSLETIGAVISTAGSPSASLNRVLGNPSAARSQR
jgi:hypothetical protein